MVHLIGSLNGYEINCAKRLVQLSLNTMCEDTRKLNTRRVHSFTNAANKCLVGSGLLAFIIVQIFNCPEVHYSPMLR